MSWIAAKMKWIMLVSGALTCTMIFATIAPDAALQSTFGATMDDPLAGVIVRSWGALIALVGAMLIYGAFRPLVRPLILIVAGLSKLNYIGLLLAFGTPYLGKAGLSLALDAIMVLLFAGYLIAVRRRAATA